MTNMEKEREDSGANQFVSEILKQVPEYNIHETLEFSRGRLSEELAFFWTRATYFSAIVAAIIAGIAVLSSKKTVGAEFEYHAGIFGLSIIGIFVSSCWYFANVGGKFWYERWERLVGAIEREIYKTEIYLSEHGGLEKLGFLEGKRHSVTKIAVLLSVFMMATFTVLGMYPMYYFYCLPKLIFSVSSAFQCMFAVVSMLLLTFSSYYFVFLGLVHEI